MSATTELGPHTATARALTPSPESPMESPSSLHGGASGMSSRRQDRSIRVQLVLKRMMDICVAIVGMIILSPLLLALAIAVLMDVGRPIIFRQTRHGKERAGFMMLKFRTMRDAVDEHGRELPDGERLTRFGRALRRTSLDELPQLVNVLQGDLSLVGPRPLFTEFLPLYSPRQDTRHHVAPGITGWAQIHGRNALSWEEKFALDADYVERWTFWLDVRILARTAIIVFRRHGISSPGHDTMPRWTGSPPGTP